MRPFRAILFSLFAAVHAVPLVGLEATSISPDRGPVAGGTEVTIRGSFPDAWNYGVMFGSTWGAATTHVDEHTLVATTPAHFAGTVPITIFEYDRGVATELTFTFEGRTEDGFERVLLPVFTPPIRGALGSEFRTDFRALMVSGSWSEIYGLRTPCVPVCVEEPDAPYVLYSDDAEATPEDVDRTGTPGAFLYLPKYDAESVSMTLRAYDTSRSAENFGTEIPIVRGGDFATGQEPITLIGIPSDPRFRNTLRIYSLGDTGTTLAITIEGELGLHIERVVALPPQPDLFHPGYVELSNFPSGVGMLHVTIEVVVPPISTPIPPPDRWAFVSVTNNETQHITLITPQP